MSAPDTNVEKQTNRHKPPLIGMGAAVGFAAILLAIFIGWTFSQSDTPEVAPAPAPASANE